MWWIVERVEFVAYKLMSVSRTLFDQWKDGRDEGARYSCWACFKEACLGRFFPRELKESKVREFLMLKEDFISVHEYELKSSKCLSMLHIW